MHGMITAIVALQVLILIYVAALDVATRLIRNDVCFALALLGMIRQFTGPTHLIESLVAATLLFLLLIFAFERAWIGGGDVKLLTALAIGLPLMGVVQLITVTAYAGAVLALVHLLMRRLPAPGTAPAGSSLVRRIYAVERWRHLRRAPLPYGAAIACGGVWALLSQGH
jgi:prepilin peptidase CpaA